MQFLFDQLRSLIGNMLIFDAVNKKIALHLAVLWIARSWSICRHYKLHNHKQHGYKWCWNSWWRHLIIFKASATISNNIFIDQPSQSKKPRNLPYITFRVWKGKYESNKVLMFCQQVLSSIFNWQNKFNCNKIILKDNHITYIFESDDKLTPETYVQSKKHFYKCISVHRHT